MTKLDRLLARAETADPMTRIDLRDPIAECGEPAILRLEAWLSDPKLARFAVRAIEKAAANPCAADVARTSLRRARANCDESVAGEIDDALRRIGRSAKGPRESTVRSRSERERNSEGQPTD